MFTKIRMLLELADKALFFTEQHANEYCDWYVKKYGKEPPDVKRKENDNASNFVYLDCKVQDQVLSKIITVMNDKKVRVSDLCSKLGKDEHLFTDWKSGRTKSYMKYIPQIAQILNVPISSLYGEVNETKV